MPKREVSSFPHLSSHLYPFLLHTIIYLLLHSLPHLHPIVLHTYISSLLHIFTLSFYAPIFTPSFTLYLSTSLYTCLIPDPSPYRAYLAPATPHAAQCCQGVPHQPQHHPCHLARCHTHTHGRATHWVQGKYTHFHAFILRYMLR